MLVQIFWGLPINNLVKIGKPSKPSSIRKRIPTKFVVQLDPISSLPTLRYYESSLILHLLDKVHQVSVGVMENNITID